MVVVCGVLAVALIAVVVVLTRSHQRVVDRLTGAHAVAEEAWVQERRELINRVQAPEHIPRGSVQQFEMPEIEPDDSNLVGQINYDGTNGD